MMMVGDDAVAVRIISRAGGFIEMPIHIAKFSGLVNAFAASPRDDDKPKVHDVIVDADARILQLVGEFMTHLSGRDSDNEIDFHKVRVEIMFTKQIICQELTTLDVFVATSHCCHGSLQWIRWCPSGMRHISALRTRLSMG